MSARMFSSSVFTALETFTLIIMAVVATPVLIDAFGLAGYGAFVFLNIFSIYGALYFFDLGMEGSVMTYVAKYEAAAETDKLQGILVVAVLYYAAIGLAVALALYLGAGFIAGRFIDTSDTLNNVTIRSALNLVAVNILLQFLALPFVAVLQGMRRYAITKSVNSVVNIVQYSAIMIFAQKYGTIDVAFKVIVVVSVLRVLTYVYICRFRLRAFRDMRYSIRLSLFRTLFGYSSVLFLCRVMGLINKNIDKLLIWWYLPVASMGVYDVIARPSQAIRVPEGIVGVSVIPETARMVELCRIEEIRNLYIRLVRYTYLLQLPAAALIYVFAGEILQVWVGPGFAQYGHLLLVLLTAYLIAPASSIAFQIIIGMEKLKKAIWISLVGTGLNAVLSLVLVTQFGILGLLLATLASQLFMLGPYILKLSGWIDMRLTEIGRPLLLLVGSTLPFVALHFALKTLLPISPVVLLVVAGVAMLIHYLVEYQFLLDDQEKRYLKEVLRRSRNGAGLESTG